MCGARAACPERVKIVSCRRVRITDASGIAAGPLSMSVMSGDCEGESEQHEPAQWGPGKLLPMHACK
eukprot:152445-Chlamydomonas_euryale.AAC.1